MPFRRRRHPLLALVEDRPLVLAFLLVLGTGIVGGIAWWLARGPRDHAADDPALFEMFASGKALEAEYLAIAATRTPTSEDLALLGRAVENQRNWMRAVGGNDPDQLARLRQMESTYDAARARLLAATSRESEAAARADIAAGDPAAALPKLIAALDAQRELNRGHPRAEHRDLARENQLAQQVEALRAEPLAASLATAVARAGEATAAGRSEDALIAWREAREIQTRINREFPRVRHADLSSLDRIEAEIDTLGTEPAAARIAELLRDATDAASLGRAADAAKLFSEAVELQRAINTGSPRSRHVSPERLELLEVERQTALGSALAARIAALDRELTVALAEGDVAAALQRIAEGGAAMDELVSRYPRSRQADPGLRLKFDYLTTVRETLAGTVATVRDGTVALPGNPGYSMLRTEVPQELYERVMGANPSRARGALNPVDSVTWHDAVEFCRRLSWICGRAVRLPTEGEFRAAFGAAGDAAPEGLVWHPPFNDLRARRVTEGTPNAAGFVDLAGNVGEWLEAAGAPSVDSAPVAGGSFTEVPVPGAPLPVEVRARGDRSRSTGFRFVIEGG